MLMIPSNLLLDTYQSNESFMIADFTFSLAPNLDSMNSTLTCFSRTYMAYTVYTDIVTSEIAFAAMAKPHNTIEI